MIPDDADFDGFPREDLERLVRLVALALRIDVNDVTVKNAFRAPGCGASCGGPCERPFSSVTVEIDLDGMFGFPDNG